MYAYLKNSLLLSLIFTLFLSISTYSQALFINEMMSSNSGFYFDEDGDDSDWIEIYNNTSSPINLLGYCLTDKSKELQRWCFPDTTIGAYAYLVVFASNKDRAIKGAELHTNFAISAAGEDLFLTFNDEIVHMLPEIELQSNHSYGLFPDASSELQVFSIPTPGETNWYQAPFEELSFSHRGGIYDETFVLTLENKRQENKIHYTTDGNDPTPASILYEAPLIMDSRLHSQKNISQILMSPPDLYNPPPIESVPKAIIIKAAVYNSTGDRVSDVITHSYFIKELGINHNNLPIVSLSIQHEDLFDYETGIMVPGVHWDSTNILWSGNYWGRGDEWERSAFVELYEPDNSVGFSQNIGLRMHGNIVRVYPQKGFRMYARSSYGKDIIRYKLFDERKTTDFKRLILKPFSSSGRETGIENFLANKFAEQLNIDVGASRPVILYLNGEYWGIYYIYERVDEHFISTYNDTNTDSVDVISDYTGFAAEGSGEDYLKLNNFIENHDLTVSDNYNIVKDWIDINSFIDYLLLNIYLANNDWPVQNMKCWRSQREGSKWRWVVYDSDAALIYLDYNMFHHSLNTDRDIWSAPPVATLFFRKLMDNEDFRSQFFHRFEFVINNYLNYNNTVLNFRDAIDALKYEIKGQGVRFGNPKSYEDWEVNIGNVNRFLQNRSCIVKAHALDTFSIHLNLIECTPDNVEGDVAYGQNFGIAPNPSSGSFRIEFTPQNSGNFEFYLLNMLGQKIQLANEYLNGGISHSAFHNIDAPAGVYHLVIQGENENQVEKIVISNE
ncbi:MAG: hypothetical protein CVV22_09285 [Ignavibacteriae bacterium HGW-Ignavibacteriae-1]|jgi:hypothetical protein|nr:MAG: hypothetical protein CVV22_09285 [Ignavibacteriae bacterium HGW-Ignavibacteriae-1]